MLKVSMDVEAANQALRDGKMQQIMTQVMDMIHPEAAFFTTDHGKRTAFLFFDLKDPAMIPQIAEPFFSVLRAEVDLKPVMNRDELMRGLQGLGARKAA